MHFNLLNIFENPVLGDGTRRVRESSARNKATWEFAKNQGPKIDPKNSMALIKDTHKEDLQFSETAT